MKIYSKKNVTKWRSLYCYLKSKSFKGALSGLKLFLRQFLTTESPSKMMKSTLYFTLKSIFFVLKIFKFLSWIFGMWKNQVNFQNFWRHIPGKQAATIHNCPISQELRQFNRIQDEKHFSSKILHRMRCRNYHQTLF